MTDLRQAAQALLNRWDSPLWKNGSTADAIADLRAALEQQVDPVYKDSTPHLHVGDSAFESWFQAQPFATQTGIKQISRDSYAAGMGDPLVVAAPQQQAEPIGWLDGNDKLAEFMHRDLKAEHDKRGSATPRDFTVPVYTAPPQRKPLTGEEIADAANSVKWSKQYHVDFARAIEAAHHIQEPKS